MANVDIIIPIYNGLDDLKKCLVSVKKHTNLENNRVILVNDKSPDERVLEYLYTQQDKNVILIDSPVNEGFSASVNKGICYSDRDVILLNSDTIVTAGWVEKIVRCAYSDDAIGTVTPLSNSATLCSVPITCQDNDIPEGRTIDEYAEIVEKCSLRKYPEITVAVGFCMHIKRTVIEQVGLFDGKTFERGYGEENDFCNRAGLLGYKHVMCDDTLVYHKGTVSFVSEEKQILIDKHTKILDEWYPYQMKKNHLYCMNNPDQYIRDNVNIWNSVDNGKTNILLMVQSDFREDASDNKGGTQFHVKDIVDGLKHTYNVFVAARDLEFLRLTMYDEDKVLSFKFYIGPADEYPQIHDMRLKPILKKILEGFAISMVHIHHVYNLSYDIFTLAKEMNIPYIMTVHDFYYICPTIKLNNCNGTLCTASRESELCAACLEEKCEISSRINFVETWRNVVKMAIAGAEKVIFPSDSAKQIFSIYYPERDEKYIVIPHGLDKYLPEQTAMVLKEHFVASNIEVFYDSILEDNFIISGWAFMYGNDCKNTDTYLYITDSQGKEICILCDKKKRRDVATQMGNEQYTYSGFSVDILGQALAPGKLQIQILLKIEDKLYLSDRITEVIYKKKNVSDKKLKVAFLGGLVPEKGSRLAYQLICNSKADVNWYIIGGINDADLSSLRQDNVIKYGPYDREDTFKILKEYNIDILCILPTWPETFCYTLSEAWLAGIPVICTSMGALTERFEKNQGGWLFELSDHLVTDIDTLLVDLCENPEKVDKMKEYVRHIDMKSVKQMCEEYETLYHDVADNRKIEDFMYKEEFLEAFRMEKNRFCGDAGIVAERLIERTVDELSTSILQKSKQLLKFQEQYEKVIADYGDSMKRLDSIRDSFWYKLYRNLKRK